MKKHNKVLLASAGLMAGLTAAAAAGAGPVVGVSAAVIGLFGSGLLVDKVKEYYKELKDKEWSSDRDDVLRGRYPEIFNSDGSPKARNSDSTPKGGDR